jgi:hypothetical protein
MCSLIIHTGASLLEKRRGVVGDLGVDTRINHTVHNTIERAVVDDQIFVK